MASPGAYESTRAKRYIYRRKNVNRCIKKGKKRNTIHLCSIKRKLGKVSIVYLRLRVVLSTPIETGKESGIKTERQAERVECVQYPRDSSSYALQSWFMCCTGSVHDES